MRRVCPGSCALAAQVDQRSPACAHALKPRSVPNSPQGLQREEEAEIGGQHGESRQQHAIRARDHEGRPQWELVCPYTY